MRRSSFPILVQRLGAACLAILPCYLYSEEPPLLSEARAALAERIPEIAAHKLETLLERQDLTEADRNAATLVLGEAYLEEGANEEARMLIQPLVAARDPVAILLEARILTSLGQWDEALPLFQKVSDRSDLTAKVGEAECLHALGRAAEAASVLEPLSATGVGGSTVRLRLANFYVDSRQLDKAQRLLASIGAVSPTDEKWKQYIEARLLLSNDQAAPALYVFEKILADGEDLSERLLYAATYGKSEANAILNGNAEGHKVIEKFISAHPDSAFIESAFRRLDEFYAREASDFVDLQSQIQGLFQSEEAAQIKLSQAQHSRAAKADEVSAVTNEIGQIQTQRRALELQVRDSIAQRQQSEMNLRLWWEKSKDARFGRLAAFYLAKIRVRGLSAPSVDKDAFFRAANSVATFLAPEMENPLLPSSYLIKACLMRDEVFERDREHVAKISAADAVRALDAALRNVSDDGEMRGEIELRQGLVHYQQGDQVLAASYFEEAVQHSPSKRLQRVAGFDLALAWLNQHQATRFRDAYRGFASRQPDDPLRCDLMLEEGLVEARKGDPEATASLNRFIRTFPDNPREGEARLALAELAFTSGGGETVLASAPHSPEVSEHAEYFAIFVADAQKSRDDKNIITLAKNFLEAHPGSPFVADVWMKLCEVYYRHEDYANAETQFDALAKAQEKLNPPGPYAETARFEAGRSAMGLGAMDPSALDRALGYFMTVATGSGPLKLYARQEQAAILQSTGKEEEANLVYQQEILKSDADAELRQAALCGMGINLRALGKKNPAKLDASKLDEAVRVFDQLANLPDVTPEWRNQALYNKGRTLDMLDRSDDALEAYYAVLTKTAEHGDVEYFWYYKAGFDAAALLEKQSKWKSAIAIYAKMAKFGGKRKAEAEAHILQLQLEHFITWD